MEPVVEPYTDHPPGYALYIIPFLAFFGDPLLAAAVAHGMAVALFFVSVAFFFHVLGLPYHLRIAGHLLFALLPTFQLVFGNYWTEPLFMATTLAGGAYTVRACSTSTWMNWWLAAICFFLASSLKIVGVLNLTWFLFPLLVTRQARRSKTILAVLACTLPVLIWFTRNQLRYGRISYSHLLGEPDLADTLLRPLYFFRDEFFAVSIAPWSSPILMIAACALLLMPWMFHRGFWREAWRSTHAQLLYVLLVHFFGLWFLSVVTFFSILDDRLLSPSIALGIITVLHAIQIVPKETSKAVRLALGAAPFVFLLLCGHTARPALASERPSAGPLAIAQAWQEIEALGVLANSSHFYSDRDFRHQLYADRPQRILWDTTSLVQPGAMKALLQKGTDPFFVLHANGPELRAVERAMRSDGVGLERLHHPSSGLVVLRSMAASSSP